MDSWSLFITFDNDGLSELLTHFENAKNNDELFQDEKSLHYASVLLPASWIEATFCDKIDFSQLLNGFYGWNKKKDIFDNNFISSLQDVKTYSSESKPLSDEEVDVLTDAIHQLADETPTPGSFIFQVYIFIGNGFVESPHFNLMGALKRLEVWHQCSSSFVSKLPEADVTKLCTGWYQFINFHALNSSELLAHCSSQPLWYGALNAILEKRSGEIHINNYYLYLPHGTNLSEVSDELPFLEAMRKSTENSRFMFDNQIQIVSMVTSENLPLHLISPVCFRLKYLNSKNEDIFKLAAKRKDLWFLGFLKYGIISRRQENLSSADWNSFLNEKFTQYISAPASRIYLKKHCSLLMRCNGKDGGLDVYFFRSNEVINATGLLGLLETFDKNQTFDEELIRSAAEYISPFLWCEKTSWLLEENCLNVGKSISRCKSDDFYMNGVMKPGPETNKEGLQKDSFVDMLSLFDSTGKPTGTNFQPIPMIPDRLLRNMKKEGDVKNLNYSEAEKMIGHGIEYCVDSLCAVRLDNRLLKIQKRFVPEDTINLNSYNPKPLDEPATVKKKSCNPKPAGEPVTVKRKPCNLKSTDEPVNGKKRKQAVSKSKKEKLTTQEKSAKGVDSTTDGESRSQRHMRRLRTLIAGTVQKYGSISVGHPSFQTCCDQLFSVCVPLLKSLTSSKGLNEQMKQIAKDNVAEVVKNVISESDET